MITTLSRLLNACGITPTPQRLAIFKSIRNRHDHPGVDAVFDELRQELPTLSKTTVYSTLQLLAEKHLIRQVHCEREELKYDGTTVFHAHFRCQTCGRLFDIPTEHPHRRPFVKLPGGFKSDDEELVYYGLCPDCNNQKKGMNQ